MTIAAVFERGVFRPLAPVDLPEGTAVTVEAGLDAPSPTVARLAVFRALAVAVETGTADLAARHDEHQP